MLVISRKEDESIRIGDAIRIVVSKINGKRIRLVIDAPKSVNVLRGELWLEQLARCGALEAESPIPQEAEGIAFVQVGESLSR